MPSSRRLPAEGHGDAQQSDRAFSGWDNDFAFLKAGTGTRDRHASRARCISVRAPGRGPPARRGSSCGTSDVENTTAFFGGSLLGWNWISGRAVSHVALPDAALIARVPACSASASSSSRARAGAGRSVRRARHQPQYSARGPGGAAREIRHRRSDLVPLPALARGDAARRLGFLVRQPRSTSTG